LCSEATQLQTRQPTILYCNFGNPFFYDLFRVVLCPDLQAGAGEISPHGSYLNVQLSVRVSGFRYPEILLANDDAMELLTYVGNARVMPKARAIGPIFQEKESLRVGSEPQEL
jgi:hypothetical protein